MDQTKRWGLVKGQCCLGSSDDTYRADVFILSTSVAKIFHLYEHRIRAKYNKTNIIPHITIYY